MLGEVGGVVFPQSTTGCLRKVLAFNQQWNKSLLFKFETFISDKAYIKLDFDCKNQTEENEIMCQFKTRYFLNQVV